MEGRFFDGISWWWSTMKWIKLSARQWRHLKYIDLTISSMISDFHIWILWMNLQMKSRSVALTSMVIECRTFLIIDFSIRPSSIDIFRHYAAVEPMLQQELDTRLFTVWSLRMLSDISHLEAPWDRWSWSRCNAIFHGYSGVNQTQYTFRSHTINNRQWIDCPLWWVISTIYQLVYPAQWCHLSYYWLMMTNPHDQPSRIEELLWNSSSLGRPPYSPSSSVGGRSSPLKAKIWWIHQ